MGTIKTFFCRIRPRSGILCPGSLRRRVEARLLPRREPLSLGLQVESGSVSLKTSVRPIQGFDSGRTGVCFFGGVLITSRGAAACRIQATLRRMRIRAAAIYSEADRHSVHVRQADI